MGMIAPTQPSDIGTRVRSVILALAFVWVCGTFDLMLTHSEARAATLTELNPFARQLVDGPLYVLAAYKYGLLGLASVILVGLRSYRQSEWGAWFLAGSHSVLVAYWGFYLTLRGPVF
jgi:hypothetical protein